MKFRIRYADQVVGVFIILAFVALASLLVAVGAKQRWFARDYRYESRFASGSGLATGTAILLKGFQVGRIESISLTARNEAAVVLVIYDTFADRVRENSLLEYVTSPIGLGSQLLFHPGKSEKRAAEHSFIPSFDTPEGKRLVDSALVDRPPKDDTITRLISNVNPLLENVNATVLQLEKTITLVNGAIAGDGSGPVAKTLVDASATVANVKTLTAELNTVMRTTMPRVDRIAADAEKSVPVLLDQLEASSKSISAIVANFEKTSASLADPTGAIPKLLDPKGSLKSFLDDNGVLFRRVDNSFAQVESTLGNLNRATASLADQMPRIVSILEEARAALTKAEDVMEGLKNNPLLRGGISERAAPAAAPTGNRTTDF
ncbi:MAG: MlaD family protein [Treponemataceae bacterium]